MTPAAAPQWFKYNPQNYTGWASPQDHCGSPRADSRMAVLADLCQ